MPHSETKIAPYTMWNGKQMKTARVLTFGELGTIPLLQPKKKLDARDTPVRYMHGMENNTIAVQGVNAARYRIVRTKDFRPYTRHHDPCHQIMSAFSAQIRCTTIDRTTPDTSTHAHAKNYPDADQWAKVHDEELNKLDQSQRIQRIPNKKLSPREPLILLKMKYRYKRSRQGQIVERKARRSAGGDRMQTGVQYDRDDHKICGRKDFRQSTSVHRGGKAVGGRRLRHNICIPS